MVMMAGGSYCGEDNDYGKDNFRRRSAIALVRTLPIIPTETSSLGPFISEILSRSCFAAGATT